MSNVTNAYTFNYLPETFKTIQERVEKQNAQDKANGYTPESQYKFNSQGEAIHTDGSFAWYFKKYTDATTGESAIINHSYKDTDSNGTYDEYYDSFFNFATDELIEKALKEGQIFNMDGMYLRDTDDNGEFDNLLMRADEHGFKWHTYTRESDESNTFTRGFMEKTKDFFKNLF